MPHKEGKRRKGAGKGQSFEREICKSLSLWITGGKRSDVFWRSSMSGGRATIAKGKVRQAGDICAVAPEGHQLTDKFFIELKFNNTLEIEQFILGGYGKLARYWQKACEEAQKYGRDPVLIAKQNHSPTIVICRRHHLQHWFEPIADVFNYETKTYFQISLLTEWLASPFPRRENSTEEKDAHTDRTAARLASSAMRETPSGRPRSKRG